MTDLIAAAAELYRKDFVHHDLNPKNAVRKNGRYKAIDFDGATHVGGAPPPGSWENGYAAIEYESDRLARKYGPASDLFSVSATVFRLMTGRGPLSLYAEKYFPEEWKVRPGDAVWEARKQLFNHQARREEFEAMVKKEIGQLFSDGVIPDAALARFSNLSKKINAGLTVVPASRMESLDSVVPGLPQQAIIKKSLPVIQPSTPLPIVSGARPTPPGTGSRKIAEACHRLSLQLSQLSLSVIEDLIVE